MNRIKNILLVLVLILVVAGCSDRGKEKEFNGVQLFYKPEITEAQADALGKYLIASGFADGKKKTVQITKPKDVYQFRMVVAQGYEKDEEYADIVKKFAGLISEDVFSRQKVEIHLCDKYLKTLRVIPM